jgi:hypothetical protein
LEARWCWSWGDYHKGRPIEFSTLCPSGEDEAPSKSLHGGDQRFIHRYVPTVPCLKQFSKQTHRGQGI